MTLDVYIFHYTELTGTLEDFTVQYTELHGTVVVSTQQTTLNPKGHCMGSTNLTGQGHWRTSIVHSRTQELYKLS